MSTRIAYIEKLTKIAGKEKGMRRAFLLARVREAEAESDEQFCRKMRVTEMSGSAERESKGRTLSRDSNGRALSDERAPSGDSNERALSRRVPAGDRMMR
jgi:hypothetical protein